MNSLVNSRHLVTSTCIHGHGAPSHWFISQGQVFGKAEPSNTEVLHNDLSEGPPLSTAGWPNEDQPTAHDVDVIRWLCKSLARNRKLYVDV